MSLLQKNAALQGGSSRNRCRLNVKLWLLTDWWWCFLTLMKAAGIKSRVSEIKSRREAGPFAGPFAVVGLRFCTSLLAARCPARVARCPPPRHDRTCLIYCSRHPSSRAPHRYSVPQPQAAEQPFKPSAPPRRHCQRPQLVKGKSPQGSRVTVQIEQYFLSTLLHNWRVVLLLLRQRRGSLQACCHVSLSATVVYHL